MRVAYFGTIEEERSPRVRMLREGMRRQGIEVVECRARGRALPRFSRLASSFLRSVGRVDAIVVPKPGQREVPLASTLAKARRVPLIHDFFASLWINQIHERRRKSDRSLLAHKFRMLDRVALSLADLSLVDTHAHGDLFRRKLGAPADRLRRVLVGAEDVFQPASEVHKNHFDVTFCGTFIPFHGVGTVLQAARLLKNERSIRWTLIGDGPDGAKARAFQREHGLDHVRFVGTQPYDDLPQWLQRADLCLGLFGDSETARAVVPKKVYAALACGRPVLTADSPGVREVLGPETVFTCRPNDARSVADAVLRAADDPIERRERGQRGLAFHRQCGTTDAVGKSLRAVLEEAITSAKPVAEQVV